MICDWCKVQIQNKLLHWFDSLFLNKQQMWVSEAFLCAFSLIQLIKSPIKPEPRLYVHIWQNNHQIYKGNQVSFVVVILGGTGKISLSLPSPAKQSPSCRYYHQSCQHYNNNYYTVFYIQQVINKLKVISAVCVVKEHV